MEIIFFFALPSGGTRRTGFERHTTLGSIAIDDFMPSTSVDSKRDQSSFLP